jgi:hypothetical protein
MARVYIFFYGMYTVYPKGASPLWPSWLQAHHETEHSQKKQEGMITQVLSSENMKRAYAQVVTNKGAAGIDGRSVNDLPGYLKEH